MYATAMMYKANVFTNSSMTQLNRVIT